MDVQLTLSNIVGDNVYCAIEFVSFFIFSFTGSLLKEIYNTNADNGHNFGAQNVLLSTIVATLCSVAFRNYFLIEQSSWGIMAFVSFVFGLIGFEIFVNLSSIDGIKKLVQDFKDIFIGTRSTLDAAKQLKDSSSDEYSRRKSVNLRHPKRAVIHHPDNSHEKNKDKP